MILTNGDKFSWTIWCFLVLLAPGLPLRVGQYLNVLLEVIKDNGRFAQLSVRTNDVATAMAAEDQNWGFGNLLPGLVVNAEVQKVQLLGSCILLHSHKGGSSP